MQQNFTLLSDNSLQSNGYSKAVSMIPKIFLVYFYKQKHKYELIIIIIVHIHNYLIPIHILIKITYFKFYIFQHYDKLYMVY